MGSRIARCCLTFVTVMALCLSMVPAAFAAGDAVSVTTTDATQGAATTVFPSEWTAGENRFDVASDEACVAMVIREDGTTERLYAAVVNEETGRHRFKVDSRDGDKIVVALKGDADLDGGIDFADATTVNQYLLGLYSLREEGMMAADADSDDGIDFADATTINQYLLGLYTMEWDVNWTLDDSEIPPVPDDGDPDEDAVLMLAADKNTVHIGETVSFTLTSDIENDYDVSYSVLKDGQPDDIGLRGLGVDGGTVTFDESDGTYVFSAVATTSTGVQVRSNEVTVQVGNQAPVITEAVLTPNYRDTSTGYEEATAIALHTTVSYMDPDGDKVTLHFLVTDNDEAHSIMAVGHSYRDPGEYTLQVYAEDEWGARSEVVTKTITIREQDEVPFIATEDLTVHIGESFEVEVNEEVLEDVFTTWTLTRNSDGAKVSFDQSNMTKYGGTMAITDGTGVYTLHAVGTEEYGTPFDMDTLVITVTNSDPNEPDVSHVVVYDDFENPFTDDAKVKVDFTIADKNDPDSDDTVVWVQNDSGEDYVLEDGYYTRGEHTLNLYTVDEWGAKSAVVPYTFTVNNVAPNLPQFNITVDYNNWKYVDGERTAWVTIEVVTSDDDGNPTRPVLTSVVKESGYYPAGHYTVEGYTEDAWLTSSGNNASYFDVVFEESYLTVNGIRTETYVHQGDEFEVKTNYGSLTPTSVQWKITGPDGEIVRIGSAGYETSTGFTDAGGKMTISATTGTFIIEATATLKDPNDATRPQTIIDTYTLHITNDPPVTPEITVNVDYSNVTSVDGQLWPYVTVGVTSSDPEGDEFEIAPYDYQDGAEYVYESGYMPEGSYTAAFIATDEFGASSVNRNDFVVRFPEMPYVHPETVTAHIGDLFDITVSTAGMTVDRVDYTLVDVEEELVSFVNQMDEDGGQMAIETVDGTYVLTVTMVFPDGTQYVVGTVDITITNTAPVAHMERYELKEYNEDEDSLLVDFTISHRDPDSDEYDIYYAIDDQLEATLLPEGTDGETLLSLWCTNGEHVLYLYGIDEWGKQSEVFEFPFVSAPYLDPDTIPVIDYTVTDTFQTEYQSEAKRLVTFDLTWMLDEAEIELDMAHVTIYYEVDGETVSSLDNLYFDENERHYIRVWAEDVLGAVSQIGTTDFYLTNHVPIVDLTVRNPGYDPRVVEVISDEKGTDDEDLPLQIVRKANGQVVDDFNTLTPGATYELELIVTDKWGAVTTATGTLVLASDAPILTIESHEITNHDLENVLSYVEFKLTTTNYNESEYVIHYWVDDKPVDGLDGWFELGQHTVMAQAESKLEPGKVSNLATYTFIVADNEPNAPILTCDIDREDIINKWTEQAAVKVTFDFVASDSDTPVDQLVTYWVKDGEVVDDPNGYYGLGTHTVYAYTVDDYGLVSELGSVEFTISNEAPVVDRAWYTVNSHDSNGLNITVHWEVSDADGDETQDYSTLNSDPFVTGVVTTDGKVFILIEAMDEFGRWSEKYELLVDEGNSPPTRPVITHDVLEDMISNMFTPDASVEVQLSATSTDPDGDPVTIHWSFGEETAPGAGTSTSIGAGHTVISAWAEDSFGNRSPVASVTIDLGNDTPRVDGTWIPNWENTTNAYTTDASVWADITATVTDDMQATNPCQVYWSIDNGPFTTTNPSGYFGLGRHMVQVYAIDAWGLKSNTDTFYVEFTSEAPDTPVLEFTPLRKSVLEGTEYTTDAKYALGMTFTVANDDESNLVRIMYSVDSAEYEAAENGAISHEYVSLGQRRVEFYAVNFWGQESSHRVQTHIENNSTPSIHTWDIGDFTEDDIIDPYTSSARVQVDFDTNVSDADDDAYRIECSVNGETVTPGDLLTLRPGTYTFEIVARDIFGAVSGTVRFTETIGGSAPVIVSASAEGNNTYENMYTKGATEYVVLTYDVYDPDGDPYRITIGGEEQLTSNNRIVLGDYALGSYTVYLNVVDIWGQTATQPVGFTLTNEAPAAPDFEAVIDLNDVNDPYTRNATVFTDTTLTTHDPDVDNILRNYFSVNGSPFVYEGDGVFDDDYYPAGTYEIQVYSVDPWGEQSPTTTYELVIGGGVDVVINKPGVLGGGQSTSGYDVPFTVNVTSDNLIKLSWLDFYEDGRPVTVVGTGLDDGVIALNNGRWSGNNHMLVVQAVTILGEVDYDMMFFMTGVSDTSGSVSVGADGATLTTPALVDDGMVLGYVDSFKVSVPTIDGHSSGNEDWLRVVGIDENGGRTTLVTAPSSHAYVSITGNSGQGHYTSDGEPSSGSFTYDTDKYVSLEFTFYSPHEGCLADGGASMSYSVEYNFGSNDEILDNLDDLFGF